MIRIEPWSVFVAAWIVVLVAAVALGAWIAREALLLAFGSVVLSVVLLAVAWPMERYLGFARRWSLMVSGIIVLGSIVGLSFLIGAQMQTQIAALQRAIPGAVSTLEQAVQDLAGTPEGQPEPSVDGQRAPQPDPRSGPLSHIPNLSEMLSTLIGSVASMARTAFDALTALVVVTVGAFYLAADPGRYRRGIVRLAPLSQRAQVDEALNAAGGALYQWLIAKLIAMALVGSLAGIGTWLLGLQSPMALGLFAALTEFVPIIGPFVGAVPALLVAGASSLQLLAWTAVLFIAIQQLESNIITPIAQQTMTDIPPFVLLFAVVALGLVFGIVGVLFAAPLTVVLFVLARKLYVEDSLEGGDAAQHRTEAGAGR